MDTPEIDVLVSGCFNVLHAGHCELLEFAAQYGRVTVGINGDEYLQKKYGKNAIPLLNRAYVLRSCRYVDEVVFFNESNPSDLILRLRPKYFVRGPDYEGKALAEADALEATGTSLIIHNARKIHDSSQIVPALEPFVFEPLAL
mgnify:CR=1 FL=1